MTYLLLIELIIIEQNMKRVYDFLKEAKVYYLATMDGDQARVRPFGTLDLFNGKLMPSLPFRIQRSRG